MEAFRKSLHDLGHVEGKNIVIEYRYADGKSDSLSAFAAELVRAKVDVIVTAGASATGPAKEATTTIRIVTAQDGDPVTTGAVASLARPGGNVTGLSTLAPEIAGKRLELLKEIVPKLSRVAVFGISTNPANAQALKEIELAAKALALKVQTLDILGPKDIGSGKGVKSAFSFYSKFLPFELAGQTLSLVRGCRESSHQRPDICHLL
jgi:putative ABC transport system substrate-binding protein